MKPFLILSREHLSRLFQEELEALWEADMDQPLPQDRIEQEEALWAVLRQRDTSTIEPPVRPGVRKKTFHLAPKPPEEQKEIRPQTKRRILYDHTSRPEGALFSELQAMCGWSQKDNYEGLRLLHVWCGYGLWSEVEGNDYRIWLCQDFDRWRQLVAASKRGAEENE